jgi:probable HAF family extracellular repeat protein
MKTIVSLLQGFVSLPLLWLTLFVSPSLAQVYTVTDLGTFPGGTFSFAAGINSFGQVVGSGDIDSEHGHAFLWTRTGGIQDLGTLPGGQSFGASINDLGHVTGGSFLNEAFTAAFLWTPTAGMKAIVNVGEGIGGLSINDFDHVVGSATLEPEAFLWTRSRGDLDLNTILGGFGSVANGIDDFGRVVGYFEDETGLILTAYLWRQDLGVENLGEGQASAINLVGNVVGTNAAGHAFLWTRNGGMRDLGTLPGDQESSAAAINIFSHVVGTSISNTGSRAFVWIPGRGMRDLNTLIPPDSGWTLLSAVGINLSGQIVGNGEINGQSHAFLLTTTDASSVR